MTLTNMMIIKDLLYFRKDHNPSNIFDLVESLTKHLKCDNCGNPKCPYIKPAFTCWSYQPCDNLKEENEELKEKIAEEQYRCPKCSSKRWGRPYIQDASLHFRDWSKRKCSNCGHEYEDFKIYYDKLLEK
jgi:DNA-directed RNA polymerase subunit RPC12/RpoP